MLYYIHSKGCAHNSKRRKKNVGSSKSRKADPRRRKSAGKGYYMKKKSLIQLNDEGMAELKECIDKIKRLAETVIEIDKDKRYKICGNDKDAIRYYVESIIEIVRELKYIEW